MRRTSLIVFIGMLVSLLIQGLSYACIQTGCNAVTGSQEFKFVLCSIPMLPVLLWLLFAFKLFKVLGKNGVKGGDVADGRLSAVCKSEEESCCRFRRDILRLLVMQYLISLLLIAFPFVCQGTTYIHLGESLSWQKICVVAGICVFLGFELITLFPIARRFRDLQIPIWLPIVLVVVTMFSKVGFLVQLALVIVGMFRKVSRDLADPDNSEM